MEYFVRGTSRMLAASTHLIGEYLLVYMNADDLRSARTFVTSGEKLGVLEASWLRSWACDSARASSRPYCRSRRCRQRSSRQRVRSTQGHPVVASVLPPQG
jgi:hypothetical protein